MRRSALLPVIALLIVTPSLVAQNPVIFASDVPAELGTAGPATVTHDRVAGDNGAGSVVGLPGMFPRTPSGTEWADPSKIVEYVAVPGRSAPRRAARRGNSPGRPGNAVRSEPGVSHTTVENRPRPQISSQCPTRTAGSSSVKGRG